MKTLMSYSLILSVLFLSCVQKESSNLQTNKTMNNEHQAIVDVVTSVFSETDANNWLGVQAAFAPSVHLDYTSLAGGEPASLTPQQITESWSGILPGFDHTHHQVANFKVTINGDEATAFNYGTASHYLENPSGQNLWTVVGTYDVHLIKTDGKWLIDSMTFNFKYMDGNSDLARLAQEKLQVAQD